MPRMGGFELLERLSQAGPAFGNLPFVFLTALGDRDNELAGRRLGADDYLTKPIDFEMLGVVVENRLRRADGRAGPDSHLYLTEREKKVLTWAGRGKTSAEIAIILGLSERTVNFHCDQAIRRLDVMNRRRSQRPSRRASLVFK
jgi:DNA-binding NarL/FixJ family response regulator